MEARPVAARQDGGPSGPGPLERLGQLALVLLFLLALAGGSALLVGQGRPQGVEVLLPAPTPTPSLRAYVSGAVARPGVYPFSPGERVADLLERAGGAAPDADLERTNLAARLGDGAQVHVPRVGESPGVEGAPAVQGEQPLLDLNRATSQELQGLPGIGEIRARAIVEYRDRVGGFATLEGLLAVPGIGPATVAAIAGLVTVE